MPTETLETVKFPHGMQGLQFVLGVKRMRVNGDREKPGAKEGGGADLALLCPPPTAVTLDTSMGTEAEAIQSSPRFFLVSWKNKQLVILS